MSNLEDIKVEGVPIELKGTTYYLKYDLNAFAELEEKYGSLYKALKSLEGTDEKDDEGNVIMTEDRDDDDNIILDKEGKPKKVPRRKISIKAIRTIFWAGLIHAHPKMTELEAGALLSIADMSTLAEKLGEAIKVSMPNIKDEVNKEEVSKETEDKILAGDSKNEVIHTQPKI
jgi:hypothetical protein